MRALFPRWSNALLAGGLVCLAASLVGVPVLLVLLQRTPYVTQQYRLVEQPLPFDHRHHAGDDAIDCRYCHDLVERSPRAGMPPTTRCLGCHSQIWSQSPSLAGLWASRAEKRPVSWRKVHRLPDFVYFDHSVHVSRGVGCVSCHGRVDRMARIYQVAPLTMSWCLDCHRNPAPQLRPREHVTALAWEPPAGAQPELGEALAAKHDVAPGTSCTTCHR